jgi:hypothetical protein
LPEVLPTIQNEDNILMWSNYVGARRGSAGASRFASWVVADVKVAVWEDSRLGVPVVV